MAKDNPRARRLGEQIQRELTDLLRRDVKDGRIGNVTITAVSVTGDLRTARVYYLVFELDTSIEHGVRLTQLIDSVNKPRAAPTGGALEPDDGHVVDEGDYNPAEKPAEKAD
jgi:ribosome-binding factor A